MPDVPVAAVTPPEAAASKWAAMKAWKSVRINVRPYWVSDCQPWLNSVSNTVSLTPRIRSRALISARANAVISWSKVSTGSWLHRLKPYFPARVPFLRPMEAELMNWLEDSAIYEDGRKDPGAGMAQELLRQDVFRLLRAVRQSGQTVTVLPSGNVPPPRCVAVP